MQYFKDEFDSSVFSQEVYKLVCEETVTPADLESQLSQNPADVIFAFAPFGTQTDETFHTLGFSLISLRSTYRLNVKSYQHLFTEPPVLATGYEVQRLSTGLPQFSSEKIKVLSDTILKTSRYGLDSQLDQAKAQEFYLTWVKNSFYNGFASEVFVVTEDEQPVGMIAVKTKEVDGQVIGVIDLLGISPNHQGKGLGMYLLRQALESFQASGITKIEVITEGENIPANTIYQKAQFVITKLEVVYHKHRNK